MLDKEVRKQTINNVIGNLAGHAGITYWVKHELSGISAMGAEGYIADFLVTGFLFSAIISSIFIFMFRSKARKGEFLLSEVPAAKIPQRLPSNPWSASAVIGLIGLISVALPLGLFVAISGTPALSPEAVSLAKGIWAAIAAAIVVPVAIYHGIANSPDAAQA